MRVIHTSDFKIDSNPHPDGVVDVKSFDVFDGAKPDFLFIDSTNAERDGHTVSELDILPYLETLIAKQTGRVYVTLFSSNVFRMASLMGIAKKVGRFACLAGRSFNTANKIAQDLNLYKEYCLDFDATVLRAPEEFSSIEHSKQLILCSGSQGEYRSILSRLSQGNHQHFRVSEGDAVIMSSKAIPGNEKSISRTINGLVRQGAKVYFGDYAKIEAGGPIHGSGHARRDELQAVMDFLQPRHILPLHGELRQLKNCAELAERCFKTWKNPGQVHVLENLHRISFGENSKGEWAKADLETLPYEGRMLRFSNFVAHSLDPFLKVRKRAAQGGLVSCVLDSAGRLQLRHAGILPASIKSRTSIASMEKQIEEWAASQYRHLEKEGTFYDDESKRSAREAMLAEDLSRYIRKVAGVRPYVVVHLLSL